MNTDEEKDRAFWAEIKARPGDALPMKVYADWLDEQGRCNLAFAMRWAADRKRFPHVTPGGRIVSWWRQPATRIRRRGGKPTPWMLPIPVFDQVRPKSQPNKAVALSVQDAFRRLGEALAVLRHVVGWNI